VEVRTEDAQVTTFGIPIIATPAAKAFGKRHNCGRHGDLTVAQIARLTGLAKASIRERITNGVSGADLCAPAKANCRRRTDKPIHRPATVTALALAIEFGRRVPTWQEIQRVHPMSKDAAKRWRRAYREVVERRA